MDEKLIHRLPMHQQQWRRLQPVGFGPCKDEPPQAEACATKSKKSLASIRRPILSANLAARGRNLGMSRMEERRAVQNFLLELFEVQINDRRHIQRDELRAPQPANDPHPQRRAGSAVGS